jgi:SAM-dependent MidA family methyltransferase
MSAQRHFPVPSAAALALSRELAARIRDEIDSAGGWIGFDRYMHRVLYEPGLGYYSAGSAKFGAAGDFVTAPELGDFLARALVASLADTLRSLETPVILELGAGSGALAAQLLHALARAGIGDVAYWILEPSADLRERQRAALGAHGARVVWLESLPPEPFDGVILANEVLDALPAQCFVKRNGAALPLGVGAAADGFIWAEGPQLAPLGHAVAQIESVLQAPLADGYRSELRLGLPAWIAALGHSLRRGCMLFVDYGYVRRDYYHPQRHSGTLMCHYRHRAHDDPYLLPGLQDISVWVDFSAVADAAHVAGLELAAYTTQGQWIVESLGAELIGHDGASPQALSALKTLVLPGEMGERFKAMLLCKGLQIPPLPGRDLRDRL